MWGLNAICLIRTDLPSAPPASNVPLSTCPDNGIRVYSTLKASVFPSLANATKTPAHMLRGPWTQAKGNLLELVLRAIAKTEEPVSWDSHRPRLSPFGYRLPHYRDGSDGLMGAIRERSVPAIRRLVGSVRSEARWEDKMLQAAWEQRRQGKLGGCVALPRSPWWSSEDDVRWSSEDNFRKE
jgi:hypothetical protein